MAFQATGEEVRWHPAAAGRAATFTGYHVDTGAYLMVQCDVYTNEGLLQAETRHRAGHQMPCSHSCVQRRRRSCRYFIAMYRYMNCADDMMFSAQLMRQVHGAQCRVAQPAAESSKLV
jgi:hypothetical protein